MSITRHRKPHDHVQILLLLDRNLLREHGVNTPEKLEELWNYIQTGKSRNQGDSKAKTSPAVQRAVRKEYLGPRQQKAFQDFLDTKLCYSHDSGAGPFLRLVRSKNLFGSDTEHERKREAGFGFASVMLIFEFTPWCADNDSAIEAANCMRRVTFHDLLHSWGAKERILEPYLAELERKDQVDYVKNCVWPYFEKLAARKEPVAFLAEVQLAYAEYVILGRKRSHLPYKVVRAASPGELLGDFQNMGQAQREGGDATGLACRGEVYTKIALQAVDSAHATLNSATATKDLAEAESLRGFVQRIAKTRAVAQAGWSKLRAAFFLTRKGSNQVVPCDDDVHLRVAPKREFNEWFIEWQNLRRKEGSSAGNNLIRRMRMLLVTQYIKGKDKTKDMAKFAKNRAHIENVLQVLDEGAAKSRKGGVRNLKNALARLPQIAVDDGVDGAAEGTKLEMLVLMERGLWQNRY